MARRLLGMAKRILMNADGGNEAIRLLQAGRAISRRSSVFELQYISASWFAYSYVPKLLFMKRLFWKDIHHLLGLPVPSAYNFSTSRAASS
jgi:hypothetical protein